MYANQPYNDDLTNAIMTRHDRLFDILCWVLVETCKLEGIRVQVTGGYVDESQSLVQFQFNKNFLFLSGTMQVIQRVFNCTAVQYEAGVLTLENYRITGESYYEE